MILSHPKGFSLLSLPRLVSLCFFLSVFRNSAAVRPGNNFVNIQDQTHKSFSHNNNNNSESVEKALEVLYSAFGDSGLCHPNSNKLEPYFPKCDSSSGGLLRGPSSSIAYMPRFLQSTSDLSVAGSISDNEEEGEEEEEEEGNCKCNDESENVDEDKWFYIKYGLLALLCVCLAALAAGLTMGLMSLDPLLLTIKERAASSPEEREQAKNLLPIVEQHHRLLVSLLLLNSMSNEALPIFLDKLVPGYIAIILSVTLVLFFGEIIPSAVFTGPDQIKIASSLTPLVKIVMLVLSPLAIPIAKLLDVVLHDDSEGGGNAYNRQEMSALVRIQYEERLAQKKRQRKEFRRLHKSSSESLPEHEGEEASNAFQKRKEQKRESMNYLYGVAASLRDVKRRESRSLEDVTLPPTPPSDKRNSTDYSIHGDEVIMVEGALQMSARTAYDDMTPIRKVISVSNTMVLTEKNMVTIYSFGHSRIPVYNGDDKSAICGILITRQLIVVNSNDKRALTTLPLKKPICVAPSTQLVDLINLFQTGGKAGTIGHMALVCSNPKQANEALEKDDPIPNSAGLVGIITLEDVLEALIQEEIYDELDRATEVTAAQRISTWATKQWRSTRNTRGSNAAEKKQSKPSFSESSPLLEDDNPEK